MSAQHKNNELWLVSYADLMTLLFGFFALLYALSEDEVKKIRIDDSSSAEVSSDQRQPASQKDLATCQIENLKLQVENDNLKIAAKERAKKSDSENPESIRKTEFTTPCRLCVEWQPVYRERDISNYLDYKSDNGYLIQHVKPGGPAQLYGLQDLDIIVNITYKNTVYDIAEIHQVIRTFEPFAEVLLKVFRDGQYIDVKMFLDTYDSSTVQLRKEQHEEEEIIPGLRGRKINDLDRVQNYIPFYVDGWTQSGSRNKGTVLVKTVPKPGYHLMKYYYSGGYYWSLNKD